MATGWWAATLITITTKLKKLTSTMSGTQTDLGTIATTLHKTSTSATAPGNWSLGMATTLKKLSTAMPGVVSETGTIATTMNKLSTSLSGTATHATYDAVGAGVVFSSAITQSFNITAASGADVFVILSWSNSSITYNSITVNGSGTGTQVGGVNYYLNNVNTNGGVAIWRFPGVGTGSAISVSVHCSAITSGRMIVNAVSATQVSTVNTPTAAYGSGTAVSQSATFTGGFVFEVLAGGGASSSFGTAPSGGTNVYNNSSGTAALAINETATSPTTFSGTLSASENWCAVQVHLT